MIKVEEKIEEKIVRTVVKYKASDGTMFTDESECRNYEGSARCVLFAKYNPLVVKRVTENELFGGHHGSNDYLIDIVHLTSEEDAEIVFKLCLVCHTYLQKEESKSRRDTVLAKLKECAANKSYFVVGRGNEYDNDELENCYPFESFEGYLGIMNKFVTTIENQ